MKAFAFLPLALVGVFADPTGQEPPTLVERDLATVTSAVSAVQSALAALDTAVKGFTSDPTQVTSSASNLLTVLKDGTAKVTASSELTLTDAIGLQSVVQGLQTVGQTLVTDLQAKKPQFQQAALCTVVLQTTTDIGTASKALIDAVISKVPSAAQGIAGQLAAGVTATLDQGKAAFSAGNCTNAAGGGGSGASAPAVTTKATTTAAAPTVAVPAPTGGALTITVTAPCACTGGATTITSTRRTSATATVAIPTTGRNTTTTARPPVVTAGAAANGAVNVGALLGIAAAALVL